MNKKKITNKLIKKIRGSALVYTLFVLFTSLSVALSVAGIAVIERKSAFVTSKSNQAFQIADSGVEIILRAIRKNTDPSYTTILSITSDFNDYSCHEGVMKNINNNNVSGGNVEITFYNSLGVKMSCNDLFVNVKKIKSVGSFGGNMRAVEVIVRN